jgi:HD domain-containing protein
MRLIRHLWHLARRFLGALWPFGPAGDDDDWARSRLLAGEEALWSRMSRADRRHAIAVARRTHDELAADATRPVLAAALLHDVGKVESGFGPWRRAVVTAAALVAGHDRASRWPGRTGAYLRHDVLGAKLLAEAGSDPLTVTWAREHHLRAERWTVPAGIGAALKSADDD